MNVNNGHIGERALAVFRAHAKKVVGMMALVTALSVVGTAAAELYGNLDIVGRSSAKVTGRTGYFKIARLQNNAAPSSLSGTIEVAMWATRSRYRGGTISGTRVLKCRYEGLEGGYQYKNLTCRGRITAPRRGSYYVTLTAAEYDGDDRQFYTQDYVTFSNRIRFR
jgi:hypothetical protein